MITIYPLPEKPTAHDIIKRSIIAHPTMFADMLRDRANEDYRYARDAINVRAAQGAKASGNAAMTAYHLIKEHNDDPENCASIICEDCGAMVIALNIAYKLQCLPPHIRTQAAVDWQERNAK